VIFLHVADASSSSLIRHEPSAVDPDDHHLLLHLLPTDEFCFGANAQAKLHQFTFILWVMEKFKCFYFRQIQETQYFAPYRPAMQRSATAATVSDAHLRRLSDMPNYVRVIVITEHLLIELGFGADSVTPISAKLGRSALSEKLTSWLALTRSALANRDGFICGPVRNTTICELVRAFSNIFTANSENKNLHRSLSSRLRSSSRQRRQRTLDIAGVLSTICTSGRPAGINHAFFKHPFEVCISKKLGALLAIGDRRRIILVSFWAMPRTMLVPLARPV